MKKVFVILTLCLGIFLSSCKSEIEKHCGEKIVSKTKIPANDSDDYSDRCQDEDGNYYLFKLSFLSDGKGPDVESIYVTAETWHYYKEGDAIPCK